MRGPTVVVAVVLGLLASASAWPGGVPAAQEQSQSVRVVTVTVTVESLEPSTRGLTYRTSEGVLNSLTVAPEVTLYDEVRVGDVLVVNYIDAVVLKVTPGRKLTNFADTTEQAKAAVTDPGVKIEQQLSQVVTIDEIDVQARTVVYHGADTRRIMRAIQDPAMMKGLKVGDVVEITITRQRAISLERAQR